MDNYLMEYEKKKVATSYMLNFLNGEKEFKIFIFKLAPQQNLKEESYTMQLR